MNTQTTAAPEQLKTMGENEAATIDCMKKNLAQDLERSKTKMAQVLETMAKSAYEFKNQISWGNGVNEALDANNNEWFLNDIKTAEEKGIDLTAMVTARAERLKNALVNYSINHSSGQFSNAVEAQEHRALKSAYREAEQFAMSLTIARKLDGELAVEKVNGITRATYAELEQKAQTEKTKAARAQLAFAKQTLTHRGRNPKHSKWATFRISDSGTVIDMVQS